MFKNYLKTIIALILVISMVGIPFAQVYALTDVEALLKSLGITQDEIKELQLQTEENNPQSESKQSDEQNSKPTQTETPTETPAPNKSTEESKQDSTTKDSTETPKEENGESVPETPKNVENTENKKETEKQNDNSDKGTYLSTLLIDYAGVSLKRTHSLDKVRFTVTNQEALQIGKVTIDDKEVAYTEDSENKAYKYFEYSGDTKVIKIEFYRKNMEEPFSTIYVQILKDDKGYHTNMAPIIKYGQEEDTSRLFEIKDGSKIKEIVIYKSNSKNDYRDENIVFKYTGGKVESINKTYIEIVEQTEESFKIKINKEENDAIYKIIATDNSEKELLNQREVRLIGMKENVATMQLDYTGVSIKAENYLINKENKLKFTINNQDKVKVERVKIIPTALENTDELKISNSTFYYEQGTDLLKLEFYKKGQNTAFNEMYVYVRRDEIGKYHVNFSPSVSYGTESENSRTFNISDLDGIKDIIITRMNGYANNEPKNIKEYLSQNNTIVYQYSTDKKNNDYIGKVELNENKTECKIEINKKDKYEYYEIEVIDNSGRKLALRRYVKVAGKVSPLQAATTWDMFNPTISVNRSNSEKITFNLNKEDKVTLVKAEEVIAGKVSTEAPIENIKKNGNYITSFTFNREGMYRFTFSNGKDYSYAYYVITVKSDGEGWGLNRSPIVTNAKNEKEKCEVIGIVDSSTYSIEIKIREKDGEELKYKDTVFKWNKETGIDKSITNKYNVKIDTTNAEKGYIYLTIPETEERNAFQIKVTDKNGAIQLTSDRRIIVDKAATTTNTGKPEITTPEVTPSKDSNTELKDIATPKSYALAVDSFNPNIKLTKGTGGLRLTVNESDIEVKKMYIYNVKNGTVDEKNLYRENANITNKNFYFTITKVGMYRVKCVNAKDTAYYQDLIVTKNSKGEFNANRSPVVTTGQLPDYETIIIKDANVKNIAIYTAKNANGSYDTKILETTPSNLSNYQNKGRIANITQSGNTITINIKKQADRCKYRVVVTDEAKYDGKTINLTTDRRLWVEGISSKTEQKNSNSVIY